SARRGGVLSDALARRLGRAASLLTAVVAATLAVPAVAAAGTAAPGKPLGLTCETGAKQSVEVEPKKSVEIEYEGGVRFCKGNGTTQRVPSWDGVPLDVDVTLPPGTSEGPFPTIVMLHGYGGTKTDFEFPLAAGDGNQIYNYNNDYYAQHGYAVVNYTARGFGKSCGGATRVEPACAEHGFIHLADQRYEARDTQYLLGQLVEEGIAKPEALGVTGISYGGGQSITLAYLKNRIRCAGPPDAAYAGPGANPCAGQAENALVPWVTPVTKKPLEIKAAYARWPWSDIANSLNPNGHFLEYEPSTYNQDGASGTNSPIGIPLTSYQQALYSDGYIPPAEGYYEPANGSLEWNLSASLLAFEQPEPENPTDQAIVNSLSAFHGGFAVPSSEAPAPLLMQSGWNDDLFPPEETLRVYNSVREKYPSSSYVALQYGDIGHSRGSNTPIADQYFNTQGDAFFEERLKGVSGAKITDPAGESVVSPPNGQASTFTTACKEPQGEEESGLEGGKTPYTAATWQGLQKGVVHFSGSEAKTVSNPASEENQLVGAEYDPILLQTKSTPNVITVEAEKAGEKTPFACRSIKALEPKGTASYIQPVTEGFTMMGLPTISAKVSVSGTEKGNGQLDARLWEVNPSTGAERLVSRGDYRLEEPQTPNVVFQLHGNGYTFKLGDAIKLELTTSEYPYYYQSKTAKYSVAVSGVNVYLPTTTAGGAGKLVKTPTAGELPKREAPLPKPEEKTIAESTKAVQKLAQTLPSLIAEPPAICLTSWPLDIKLPKYKHGKIVKAVIMFKGRRVKTVKIRKGSLRSIHYTIKGSAGKTSTLKIQLKVVSTAKAKKKRTQTKRLTRNYHLCG
ncbi:MAG: alpha/beta hydrolase family protein, partial [Solirubrobacteraceae bacterium]